MHVVTWAAYVLVYDDAYIQVGSWVTMGYLLPYAMAGWYHEHNDDFLCCMQTIPSYLLY
jgi:hypothetical protein